MKTHGTSSQDVHLDAELLAAVDELASRYHLSRSAVLSLAVTQFLEVEDGAAARIPRHEWKRIEGSFVPGLNY